MVAAADVQLVLLHGYRSGATIISLSTRERLHNCIPKNNFENDTCMCVFCVFSSHSFWTSSSLDVPAGVTQEEGHTGFLIHEVPLSYRGDLYTTI